MSEGSKMGLFGSKDDKTESTSSDDTKPNPPDRYAPYCIDSDSETYDTEALSIMDINDIIGVQTGQAAESTLESEIAALTEIITDSKGETNSDMINDIDGETSEIKFNEELLTEFTSSAENPIPTKSTEDFEQRSIAGKSETENVSENSDTGILKNTNSLLDQAEYSASKDALEVKTLVADVTHTTDIVPGPMKRNSELDEKKVEDNAETEATLFSATESCDDSSQNEKVSAIEEEKLPIETDINPEAEAACVSISEVAGDLLKATSEVNKISLEDEAKADDKDLSKSEDVSTVATQNGTNDSSNIIEDVDSVIQSKLAKEGVFDHSRKEKLADVLTNSGSTSKSLQLIGEAYISEDSQETDEKDDSPDMEVASPLDKIKEEKTSEARDEQQKTSTSDNILSDTLINEPKINASADTLEGAVEICNSGNQDSISLEDNKASDNTKEGVPNLQDNDEIRSQDPSIDLNVNTCPSDEQIKEEDKSVDSSLHNDENIDESYKSDKVTSLPPVSIDPAISSSQTTTAVEKSLDTEEQPLQHTEHREIESNSEAETVEMPVEGNDSNRKTNLNSEEVEVKSSDEPKPLDEAMEISETDIAPSNSNSETVSETENLRTKELKPSEDLPDLPSHILPCSNTESENTTETIPENQIQRIEGTKSVESEPEPMEEQDNTVLVESDIEKRSIDSQDNGVSITSLQQSIIEDENAENVSKSSIFLVEAETSPEDENNKCTEVASLEEQSREISENVEQVLESIQGNTIVIEGADDEKTMDEDEDSIHEIVSTEEVEEKLKSEPSEFPMDDTSQSVKMKMTSTISEETGIDLISTNTMRNEEDLAVKESGEKINKPEDLDQSASQSCGEIKAPVEGVMEINEQKETESLEKSPEVEEISSSIVEADSLSSEIPEKYLGMDEDKCTEGETTEFSETKLSDTEIGLEAHTDSQQDAEPEVIDSVIMEDLPVTAIGTISENSAHPNDDPKSDETVETNLSKELNKTETVEEFRESQEVVEAERVDSETLLESGIVGADECDRIQSVEEKASISESLADTKNKHIEDTGHADDIEFQKSESCTKPNTEMVCDNIAARVELKTASQVSTVQDQLEYGQAQLKPDEEREEGEKKVAIHSMQNRSDLSNVIENLQELDDQTDSTIKNDETQCRELSPSETESYSKEGTKSEISSDKTVYEKQDSGKIQFEKSENKAGPDESTQSNKLMEDLSTTESEVTLDSSGNEVDEISGIQIAVEDLQEMQSASIISKDILDLVEEAQELHKDDSLPIASDNKILDDVSDIQSAEATLELIRTESGENEVEDNSQGIISNLVSEVKMTEDPQSAPIEDLEKLAVVTDEILIDELANSVLTDTIPPLENINNLEILPDTQLPVSTIESSIELKSAAVLNEATEVKDQPESHLEAASKTSLIEELNLTPSVSHRANYVTDVIISSTNIDNLQLADNMKDMDGIDVTDDEIEERNEENVAGTSENIIPKDDILIVQNITDISEACELGIVESLVLDKDIDIDLPLKQEEEKLIESAVLQACDAKIDLPDEVLFDADNAEQTDVLRNTPTDNIDTSQQSSEFSELECAVKFLQESEEQTIDSPLLLSPKMAEEIVEDNSNQSKSCLFLSETEICQDALELPEELDEITPDSIAISEAEIISEAAKLENERKLKIAAEISKSSVSIEELNANEESVTARNSEMLKRLLTTSEPLSWQKKSEESTTSTSHELENPQIPNLSENVIRRSEKIPKISILEERLKEPPKIEIPVPEVSPKLSDTPTTPKTSLLIQRDSRMDTKTMYQKMLESPKGGDRGEPKIVDTPRKDSEKHDFENVGSPRIILKIAKSAIADCGEPRSPKSPKIRSAANSPNPEDSPGQKLGKIKLKLSKGGHPSIISNENFDETAQRYTEAMLSPSHIGMKIKLSKTGDASIIQPEKHEASDDFKEGRHKFGESSPKRIESPLGMKIKLSKTGDPSIVQQESKESTSKRKDKLDIGQEIPKRTDSPIGMKIKLSKSGDASIIQPEKQESSEDVAHKDKFEITTEIPKRTESPIGMKIKLSKSGDASIISSECAEEFKDFTSKSREKSSINQDIPKRTDSPLGMKFKLSKSGGASIIQPDKSEAFDDVRDKSENTADSTKRVESPIGMKIKLSKTGDASIIHPEKQDSDDHRESIIIKHREKSETQEIHKRTDSPLGMRIKVTKTGEASVVPPEEFKESISLNSESFELTHDIPKRTESPIGMKIKLSKFGDASIIHSEKQELLDESTESIATSRGSSSTSQEGSKSTESSLGMKIKLSKTGDASIIHPEISAESKDSQLRRTEKLQSSGEISKRTDSPLGMKIKLSKTGDASIIEPDKKERTTVKQKEKLTTTSETPQKRKEMEYPLEMKIKLSKTGHPTIIANEKQETFGEIHPKSKDHSEGSQTTHHKHAESASPVKDSQLRIFKTGHSTIIQSSRSEVTIEPIQMHKEQPESSMDISQRDKDVAISPVDLKKSKLEAKLMHILPDVTIQPVSSGEQRQIMLDQKSSTISRQQMSVINQEISITQIQPPKPADLSMSGKLKEMLRKNATNSPASSDCEIIDHRPELIIVNENSNSSQDVMIIEEVKAPPLEVKIPRKRGRPKRSTLPPGPPLIRQPFPQDPLAFDNMQPSTTIEHRESDRPKRTCRSQKSYAPPKRGRGRGRGKRKMDRMDCAMSKIPRMEDPLTEMERSTMGLIATLQPRMLSEPTAETSELYKALKLSPAERKRLISENLAKHGFPDVHKKVRLELEPGKQLPTDSSAVSRPEGKSIPQSNVHNLDSKAVMISEMLQHAEPVAAQQRTEKLLETPKPEAVDTKNIMTDIATTEHQNWLTPSIKLLETPGKSEAISIVQVMDEETRMSSESNSRSQTPARNISIPAVETVINEESQGSVLSTATTESEKVKVRNRRMEINFDPDEGPFTVDKIAEYEWPLDKKGDTFMLQEQISQYLGVKSFKRKYPDLKRRMVEMEERNYLRENGLVSEAMCDMGLTAICSTEVLDIMCSDFPDQYEEYRKHMREKQAKEHSKKQKELTAAANAERNRIDLAEMAVQSALSWNVNFNKARKESRKYSLDLQSFTIHVPQKQIKVDAERKASDYPVALIPGQYTDYYRQYTPAELRYYPLNTVLYGPMRPNERKFDSQSEGSQSDSDSDSSSDDSSSSSSEGTQDTEESQSTVDEVDMDIAANKEDNKNLKCKMCLKHLNKHGKGEVLIQCGTCNGNVHPSCIDLTLDMVPHIQGYSWQCTDCKTCVQCHNPADEDKMLFCDMCDRGYHIYCVGLRRVPQGRWHCRECAVCASCGLRQPGGANSDRNSVAQWQHEYKKGERNTRVYVSTLCVPCSKLWRKGRYCPHCSRCHSAQRLDLEPNLVHCGACDKYLHLGCVEIRSGALDRKNFICDWCSTPGQQFSRTLISKNFKT